MRHTLTNLDKEKLTAICAIDGMVSVYYTPGNNRYRCRVRKALDEKRRPKRKSLNGKYQGLNNEEYESIKSSLVTTQKGLCAICSTSLVNYAALDHCHFTGKIRGLLCFKCNVAIGHMGDDIQLLHNAIKYIEEYK